MTIMIVSNKGQVVIPASIRKALGIKVGSELDVELDGSLIRISLRRSVARTSIESGYGMLRAESAAKRRRLHSFDAAQATRRAPTPALPRRGRE
ncbi:AbrB/MazE/SpoVT family DNA-binding domain-containing protein [Ramlibacter sp. WS9]|uniref:AbrB/MazE/SpoVT family DNA-binding domain-containing protein n=1 Tax=Ramlibacter sp. WS9 TaxID=1882741 RepID=UPI001142D805|nr:AbrB/MazE/SpoVT family DNA-binding domain-containing protein [Ramlibacter sp. WS9]ROZ74930.1 AbrB/MazE/SpoVT family DNA-binding domain-containing protein [Ramlibacter sp. WS9]